MQLQWRARGGEASRKDRSVPLDPFVRPLLAKHLAEKVASTPDAWVFPSRDGTRRSDKTRWFAVATQAAATRASIGRSLTFHDLRRTYGAMLIEAGVDIYTVSRLLGHADVRITQAVYAPICGRFLAQEAAKLCRYLAPSLLRDVPRVLGLKMACLNSKKTGVSPGFSGANRDRTGDLLNATRPTSLQRQSLASDVEKPT
jgi:integrase